MLYYKFQAMLRYFKQILKKVSFNRELFEKELKKAIRVLSGEELIEFRDWCFNEFRNQYNGILVRNFVAAGL